MIFLPKCLGLLKLCLRGVDDSLSQFTNFYCDTTWHLPNLKLGVEFNLQVKPVPRRCVHRHKGSGHTTLDEVMTKTGPAFDCHNAFIETENFFTKNSLFL